jgi:hypothetical protein
MMRIGKKLVMVLCFVILQACASAQIYDQNCSDVASSAGHTYERMFGEDARVAVGPSGNILHAQAYIIKDGKIVWLTITYYHDYRYYNPTPILAVGVDSEIDVINDTYSLEDFDTKYMRKRK